MGLFDSESKTGSTTNPLNQGFSQIEAPAVALNISGTGGEAGVVKDVSPVLNIIQTDLGAIEAGSDAVQASLSLADELSADAFGFSSDVIGDVFGFSSGVVDKSAASFDQALNASRTDSADSLNKVTDNFFKVLMLGVLAAGVVFVMRGR